MIQLISREEVFFESWLVDHCISDLQNPRGSRLTVAKQRADSYDHLQPFHDHKESLDDSAILSYVKKNWIDYLSKRSTAFIRFFELIEVKQLYLMDELKWDWVKFPFKDRDKRATFNSLVKQPAYYEAFKLDIADLSTILPLFHFSDRHSEPIIWFFTVNSKIPLSIFLCDDANFHTRFLSRDRDKITSAVLAAGLVMGGLEICEMSY
jgi:hypothetical protein